MQFETRKENIILGASGIQIDVWKNNIVFQVLIFYFMRELVGQDSSKLYIKNYSL